MEDGAGFRRLFSILHPRILRALRALRPPVVNPARLCLAGFRVADGGADELVGVGELELALDVLAVGLDGLDAHAELPGDFGRADAAADQLEDFELAVAELR